MKIKYIEKPIMTFEQMKNEVQRKVKIGQTICIHESPIETVPPKVKVYKFYPNYVQCRGKGYYTCYSYFDLWKRLHHRQNNIKIPKYIKGWRVDERRT